MSKKIFLITLLFATITFGQYVAPNEDTVVVVGGLGTQADKNSLNGGGATKVAWDAGSPSDFIGANGGTITADTAVTYSNGTTTFSKTGIGTGVTVGTLAYVSGTNITAGIYEITARTNDTIVCANIAATGDNTDSVVNVGGALDTLQNALDNDVNDAALYNRYIYDNITTETIGATIDVDTYGGALETRVIVKGANSSCVVDGTRIIITTGASLVNGLLSFTNAATYTQWWYIDFNAAGAGKADYCVYNDPGQSASEYHMFYDCIFRNAVDETCFFTESVNWGIFGCEIYGGGDGVWMDGVGTLFVNCSVHDNADTGIKISSSASVILNNLVYDNGGVGIWLADSGARNVTVIGNTIFGNVSHGLSASSSVIYYSRIINNTSCGNGTGGTGYGYYLAARRNTLFFAYNHSVDGLGNANDNASGHCNLMSDPTSDSEWADFLEGNNKSGDPKFANIGDGTEDFTPTSGSALIDNALDAGTK